MPGEHFSLYILDHARARELDESPRLASWDAKHSATQQALQRYLERIEECVNVANASALHLVVHHDIAGSDDRGHDLDNYLYPIVHRLGPNQFLLARASKTSRFSDRIIVGRARQDRNVLAGSGWRFASMTTTTSSDRREWKEEVHEQLTAGVTGSVAPGPIELEIAFRVGPSRTWTNLWKPAIDSLGPILGEGHRSFVCCGSDR